MKRAVIGCAITLIVVALLFLLLLTQLADIRSSAGAMACRSNMETLFSCLVEYGRTHDEFPYTSNGRLDLASILREFPQQEVNQCLCFKNHDFDCFVFQAGLRPSDLTPDWQTDDAWSIIAIDSIGNHPQSVTFFSTTGDYHVNALFSCNAATISMILTPEEHEKMIEKLDNGDIFDNSMLNENADGG